MVGAMVGVMVGVYDTTFCGILPPIRTNFFKNRAIFKDRPPFNATENRVLRPGIQAICGVISAIYMRYWAKNDEKTIKNVDFTPHVTLTRAFTNAMWYTSERGMSIGSYSGFSDINII